MLPTAFIVGLCVCAVFSAEAPRIKLNDGNDIPVVALGTGRGTAKKNESVELVREAVFWAIEAGYRHVDTAAVYGDEEQVGQGIADAIARGLVSREDLFVTTKLWSDKHARAQVVPALRASLAALGLDYVDLYLVHFPIAIKSNGLPDDIDYLETWKGMEEAQKLGLTRSIGVSNFNASQLDRVIDNSAVPPAVNEIEVNPTLTQEALVDHCKQRGVAVMAYSPFGYIVSRRRDPPPPPREDDPVLVALRDKYGKTTSQIVLRYLIERGLIVIPKSTNKDRIAQNIALFDFKLTEEEVASISAFNQDIRVILPSAWQDFAYYPFERV